MFYTIVVLSLIGMNKDFRHPYIFPFFVTSVIQTLLDDN